MGEMPLTHQRHQGAGQAAVEGPRRERRHAGRLDAAVERFVVGGEPLVVRPVARLVDIQDGHDQAGPLVVAADAAGRLDVLGAGLRAGRRPPSSPSRMMSRPTEIMLVAMATSTWSFSQ